jgi:hypothetical protein
LALLRLLLEEGGKEGREGGKGGREGREGQVCIYDALPACHFAVVSEIAPRLFEVCLSIEEDVLAVEARAMFNSAGEADCPRLGLYLGNPCIV